MVNLTANRAAAKPISDVRKWEVKKADDQDDIAIPQLSMQVRLYGANSAPWPGNPFTLQIRDTGTSYVMTENTTPTSLIDQFVLANVQLTGTPYATLVAAYYAATGKANMKKALEPLLVGLGILPATLAGT
jgi:hypothetical protein